MKTETETTTIQAPMPAQTTTTRTGKIARLPLKIREEINRRLEENEPGASILAWVNSLPETQKDGPITAQNLSNWRQGGYQDAVNEEERQRRLADLAAHSSDQLQKLDAAQLANYLTVLWLVDFNFTMRAVLATITDPMEQLKLQMECLKVIGKVQQRELQKDRQALAREKWQAKQDTARQSAPFGAGALSSLCPLPSSTPIKVNQGESSRRVGRVPPPGAGTSQIQPNQGGSSERHASHVTPDASALGAPASLPAGPVGLPTNPASNIHKFVAWNEKDRLDIIALFPPLFKILPWSPDNDVPAADIIDRQDLGGTYELIRTARGVTVRPVKAT